MSKTVVIGTSCYCRNLNLFLQPQMAAEELDMKIGAQREALEQTLNDIGYETIMNEGIQIHCSPIKFLSGLILVCM